MAGAPVDIDSDLWDLVAENAEKALADNFTTEGAISVTATLMHVAAATWAALPRSATRLDEETFAQLARRAFREARAKQRT